MAASYDNMVATHHDDNMVAIKHGRSTKHGTKIIGHIQQHKGQEGRDNNTSHKAATTVSVRDLSL